MTHSEMYSKYKAVLLDRRQGPPLCAAILVMFGKHLVLLGGSQGEMETVVIWVAFKKWLGETFLGKPRWCEMKLG